eukprot:PhF_6_TR8714/c0_g1_i1/m.13674/K14764/SHQ1; protein SHQ1
MNAFSVDHFWSDQNGGCEEDGSAQALETIRLYEPWYIAPFPLHKFSCTIDDVPDISNRRGVKGETLVWNGNVDMMVSESANHASPEAPVVRDNTSAQHVEVTPTSHNQLSYQSGREIGLPVAPPFFEYTHSESHILSQMEPLTTQLRFRDSVHAGLVNILLAAVYDDVTTCGEGNSESIWTITTLATTLSYLSNFDTIDDALHSFSRRVLCLPLYRSFDLVIRCVSHTCSILMCGPRYVTRVLLKIFWLLENDEHKHLLNDFVIRPYLEWLTSEEMMSPVGNQILRNVAQRLHDAAESLSLQTLGLAE